MQEPITQTPCLLMRAAATGIRHWPPMNRPDASSAKDETVNHANAFANSASTAAVAPKNASGARKPSGPYVKMKPVTPRLAKR